MTTNVLQKINIHYSYLCPNKAIEVSATLSCDFKIILYQHCESISIMCHNPCTEHIKLSTHINIKPLYHKLEYIIASSFTPLASTVAAFLGHTLCVGRGGICARLFSSYRITTLLWSTTRSADVPYVHLVNDLVVDDVARHGERPAKYAWRSYNMHAGIRTRLTYQKSLHEACNG